MSRRFRGIAIGRLVCLIGVAVVRPAEFVFSLVNQKALRGWPEIRRAHVTRPTRKIPDEHRVPDVTFKRGRALWRKRIGQLDLACAQCHDDNAGRRVGGSVIPQGHRTGYPIYRVEWHMAGSLQRRIRACMTGVRAESFPCGAPELVELEICLAVRAEGLAIDAPGVRP